MEFDNKNNQGRLSYTYNSAQARMSANPEYAAKQKGIVDKCQYVKPDKAVEKALQMINDGNYACRVWAKIERDEEFFLLSEQWIVTDDWDISLAAEYTGLYLVYNDTDLLNLLDEKKR